MEVLIYSKNFCLYCDKAKALLDANDIPYKEINVKSLDELPKELSRGKTFPQIFINHNLLGGFDQLLHLHQQHGLHDGLLKFVEQNGDN